MREVTPERTHAAALTRRAIAVVLIVLGIAAMPFAFLAVSVLWQSADEYMARRPFDSREWKASLSRDDLDPVRLRMVDDLMARHRLQGMARPDVVSLLGVPPTTGYFREYDLVYWLGPERGAISIDSEWLGIRFDAAGNVSAAKVLRD